MSDYTIRRADPSELPGLHRLMMTVYRALPDPEVFSVADIGEDWFLQVAAEGGFGVLAESAAGETAGFLMVVLPGRSEENLGRDIGLPEAELDRVALMDVAAVLPEHRGHGLERRMLLWAEEQLPARFDRLMCTVSPANPASLHSIERSGYRAVLTKEKYGGHLRHIMLKER